MGFVSYTILIYDHLITLPTEVHESLPSSFKHRLTYYWLKVEYIWKGSKSPGG
jgi:hypothetical protein